jgi:hypothetical protein
LQKQNNKTAMEATAGIYHVEIIEAWINVTRKGYEVVFTVDYDNENRTYSHDFNDPSIYWHCEAYNRDGKHEEADQYLVDEFWHIVAPDVASDLDDLHEAETITTPRHKRDARYEAEN